MIRIDKNYLILEKNSIDHRWKVLSDGMTIGDGKTEEKAIASARMLTDETIFKYNFDTSRYEEVV